jgi:hypothetical protein
MMFLVSDCESGFVTGVSLVIFAVCISAGAVMIEVSLVSGLRLDFEGTNGGISGVLEARVSL